MPLEQGQSGLARVSLQGRGGRELGHSLYAALAFPML
jgi:hypothetical protein